MPSFARCWQSEEHSDRNAFRFASTIDVILKVIPDVQMARFPGHSVLLSSSPMISAQVSSLDSWKYVVWLLASSGFAPEYSTALHHNLHFAWLSTSTSLQDAGSKGPACNACVHVLNTSCLSTTSLMKPACCTLPHRSCAGSTVTALVKSLQPRGDA